jgi:hypothetical protein
MIVAKRSKTGSDTLVFSQDRADRARSNCGESNSATYMYPSVDGLSSFLKPTTKGGDILSCWWSFKGTDDSLDQQFKQISLRRVIATDIL